MLETSSFTSLSLAANISVFEQTLEVATKESFMTGFITLSKLLCFENCKDIFLNKYKDAFIVVMSSLLLDMNTHDECFHYL